MRVIRGYKFKLKTTPELQRAFATMAGHARFIWNKALRLNLDRLERKAPIMRYSDLCGLLRLWKQSEEYGFLAEAHSQALQQKLRDLDRAFADAFDKNQPLKKLPRFKKKGRDDSFRFPQDVKIDNRRVCLPKIGWVGFFKSQEVPGTIRQATVKISKSHAVVALEDLPVRNMTRSAKGTLENPGRNVRAKSGLNRAILDQGWSMFERMLEYKLDERGGQVVPVPAPGSSHVNILEAV